jgi:hypothetical protein
MYMRADFGIDVLYVHGHCCTQAVFVKHVEFRDSILRDVLAWVGRSTSTKRVNSADSSIDVQVSTYFE